MAEVIQPSFAKGELAPELYGRVDTAAYRTGLATARNAIVHTYGGVSNRPGTRFLGPVKDHDNAPRLVEFEFKTTDTYILEFGNLYMRVIRNGGHVLNTSTNITAVTQANPGVVTATSHGLSNGDEVFINSIVGMVELNTNRYVVANVTANTFELTSQVDGSNVDTSGFTAYSSGGTVAEVYEITTPYAQADLMELTFVQSADVMTIANKNYNIRELSRTDHNAWTLSELTFGSTISTPADQTVTVNTTGAVVERYRVTAIDRETGEESLTGLNDVERTITGATAADPVVITATSHGFADGDEVQIDNVVGMTEINARRYVVANQTANTFELTDEDGNDIDGSSFTAYSSGGIARQTFVEITNGAASPDNTIAWTAVSGAGRYGVYRQKNGLYGLIGETNGTSFEDDNIDPDTSISPPTARDPFDSANDQPGAVGYYEQRRVFGGSSNKPDTSEFSQVGNQSNFNVSNPVKADDAITATLNSRQVNEIRHYVGQNDLLVFTSGSEWRVNAGSDNAFSADTIRQRPQSEWGASWRPPVLVGNTVLFVEEDNQSVRSFGYSLQLDGYTGSNLNILSQHLTRGFTIDDWTHLHHPESRIYMIRNDGELLMMSFDQEQEVIAWTRGDTDGQFERISSTRELASDVEDTVYVVVRRKINGTWVRYIETMKQVSLSDVRDAYYVDSGLSYDTPVAITNATAADPVVITATSHGFSDGDEVDIFDIVWESTFDSVFNESQPDQLNRRRYTVNNSTANTFELQDSDSNDIDGSSFSSYVSGGTVRLATDTFRGIDHLEGETLVALCDGNVVSNLTVSGGSVTTSRKYSRVHVGKQIVTDIETLDLEVPQGTIQPFFKKLAKLTIRFFKSRGLLFGTNSTDLTEMKQREFEDYGDPIALLTGVKEMRPTPDWDRQGRVFLRQKDPLPMTILSITPTFEAGEL